MKNYILLLAILFSIATSAAAQNFNAAQKKQERNIQAAYKHHKVTANEYGKLMDEQSVIKQAINKGAALGWTPHEKGVVAEKQERAAKRLYKYEHNSERY